MNTNEGSIKLARVISSLLCLSFFMSLEILAQPTGGGWSKNVSLLKKGHPNRTGASSDVWGWRDSQTGKDYALVTINDNLSIVETTNPSSPVERAYITGISGNLGTPDVEVYESGGNAYAYLARNVINDPVTYTVLIINLRQAISPGGVIQIDPTGSNPFNSVFVGRIDAINDKMERGHTLTIAGGILYICPAHRTFSGPDANKCYFDIWNLRVNPANPQTSDHIGLYQAFLTNTLAEHRGVHEMFVKSTGTNSARVYSAALTDGLQVFDLSYTNTGGVWAISTVSTTVNQYDYDRRSPTTRESTFPKFDRRICHSAWPTDDELYVFTTDELIPPDSAYKDDDSYPPPTDLDSLKENKYKGAFLRIWKRSELGLNTALKAGYDVPEGNQAGITTLSSVAVSVVPNSVHQLFIRGTKAYVANYTQGFRVLNISNPLAPTEDGYYDDYATMPSGDGDNSYYRLHWFDGVYGVYPDPNRPNIVYAGSFTAGLYIFSVRSFSGTIAVNTTWDGAITVSGNTTVAAGVTLTVSPGATVTFAGNYKLRVEGTLNASGSSTSPITFQGNGTPGSWAGIEFYNAPSNQSLTYCTIKDAADGVNLINSDIDVFLLNLRNNFRGANCTNFSDPSLNSTVFQENNFGVNGDGTSAPSLTLSGGFNSFRTNDFFDVYSTYSGTIYARGNWWGFCPPSPPVSPNVDYSDWLCSDPNPKLSQPTVTVPVSFSKASSNPLTGSTSVENSAQDPGMNDLEAAHWLYVEGKYQEALQALESVIANYPETFAGRRALVFVEKTLAKLGRSDEILAKLNNALATYTDKSLGTFAAARRTYQYIRRGQYHDAIAQAAGVVQQNRDTTLVKFALYDLGSLYWYSLGDRENGMKYFSQLVARFPGDPLSESALVTMGESASVSSKQQETSASTEAASEQMSLSIYPKGYVAKAGEFRG